MTIDLKSEDVLNKVKERLYLLVEDVEMAIHHLTSALTSMKKEFARRKKLAEEYQQKLRHPD